jgi:hypothetical protein
LSLQAYGEGLVIGHADRAKPLQVTAPDNAAVRTQAGPTESGGDGACADFGAALIGTALHRRRSIVGKIARLNVDAPGDTFGSQGIARGRQQRPRLILVPQLWIAPDCNKLYKI